MSSRPSGEVARCARALDPVVRVDAVEAGISRALHAMSRALARATRLPALERWELERRYLRYLAEFGEADSDLVVSTFPRSGTTWMQILLYQLTTPGEMGFDHLFDVSPWVWYSALRETPPAVTPAPRILKSHDEYRFFRRGRRGRFVFVVRDGRDVCVSLYHHRRNAKRFEGTFEQHFEEFLHGDGPNWFAHTRAWLENADGLHVVPVRYEDLSLDFEKTARRLANELGIAVDDAILARATEACSFASMKRIEHRLGPRNDHFSDPSRTPYSVERPDQFIRRGQVGDGTSVLTPAQLAAYRERFDRALGGLPLVASYR